MVQLTRLDCAVASAGLVRMGLALAHHHARHRSVFRKKLIDQPLMRSVLADLALEIEAMTALSLRLARSFDLAETDAHGGGVRPARHAGGQVRHLQGGAAPALRVDGVPRRQRLRGGKPPAPALPGGARSTRSGRARAT